MDWLTNLASDTDAPLIAALALGLLTAISPCPLATNITATAYIAKSITNRWQVLLSGMLYTLGRMLTYTLIGVVIYFGASQFHVARAFQANGEKFIGPVMILIGLVMLDVIKLNFFGRYGFTERFSEKFKAKGLLGAFLLGILFALAFCPYSGALYFGMLMPMMLASQAGLAVPVIFSMATGLPVILFAFVIAYSMGQLGAWFKAVQKIEKIMRVGSAIVFILTGVYYLNIYLKIV